MRRLYVRIYLAIVFSLFIFAGLLGLAWWLMPDFDDHNRSAFEGAAEIFGAVLPSADRPLEELDGALKRMAQQFDADIAISDARGRLLGSAGRPVPIPDSDRKRSGWLRGLGKGPTITLHLPDGRWLTARRHHGNTHGLGLLLAITLLAVAVAIAAHPVARRITRRLERLQARVEQLGSGDLSARVDVQGRDEVAELAQSFNRAAQRIEDLVQAQRSMLAAASHELRSPLTRIRMAIELLGEEERPELHLRISQDIAELDDLIDELLLASRLEASDDLDTAEDIDLLALVAEESARISAPATGTPVHIIGSARLLRRLVRNLLENAQRHGGADIETRVEAIEPNGARLAVTDRGPGVPESEREQIFEPFYRPDGMRETGEGGVGLGLALVRQIAARHGGAARCLPRTDGTGSRFEVDLFSRSPGHA